MSDERKNELDLEIVDLEDETFEEPESDEEVESIKEAESDKEVQSAKPEKKPEQSGKKSKRERLKEEKEINPFYELEKKKRNFDFLNEEEKKFKLGNAIYFAILMLYLEMVFHVYSFHEIDLNVIAIILFGSAVGLLFGFICTIFPTKANRVLSIIMTMVLSIYFCVQIVYKGVFQNYLSLSAMMEVAGQAMDFGDTIWVNIKENWLALVLLLAPIVVIFTPVKNLISYKRPSAIKNVFTVITPAALYLVAILFMKLTDDDMYSAYDVFMENTSIDMTVQKLGVTEATVLDIGVMLGIEYGTDEEFEYVDVFATLDNPSGTTNTPAQGGNTGVTTPEDNTGEADGTQSGEQTGEGSVEEPAEPRKPYNQLDIDFDKLISETNDDGLISLHNYFMTCAPTETNAYTGMFEGYNVIFITAEGFSGYALTEENYPTLYKMANEGFVFENYYTPLWYGSTVGGEYANLTGLMPANGQYLSLKETGKRENSMRLTLGTQLSGLGYATVGYHNNSYTYYGRDMSHTNMGYTWMGVGNGWEPEYNKRGNKLWPQSDDYMIATTFDDYCTSDPFHVYYLSVSGHVQYNFVGNAMSIRNKSLFEDRGYSETTQAYLACQYELEKAVTRLNELLEEKGLADNTLIVIAPDHVPYDNKDVCDELAGHELEDNFEWFENTLIIWSASMKEPVHIDKVCSSLDILPTVSNLLGLEYDSRLIVGRDILSSVGGLVMFNNRSFITDKCMYNAKNGEVTMLTEEQVGDDYVSSVKSTVRTRFKVAENILEYDYYQYIEDLFDDEEKVIPDAVTNRMAAAGYNTDGTEMSEAQKKEWNNEQELIRQSHANEGSDFTPTQATQAQ